MDFKILTFCILFLPIVLLAQSPDTVSVFFEHNERVEFDKSALDALVKSSKRQLRVTILGYADHLGSEEYNSKLSKDRATVVAKYLTTKYKSQIKVVKIQGNGELKVNNSTVDGVPNHRRVDVISVQKSGHPASQSVQEEIPQPESEELDIDTGRNSNVVLEGVEFIPGRHYPVPESREKLYKLKKTLTYKPYLKIEIQGFICCDYENFDGMDMDTQTMNLSENRAKFIYDFLVREGIDPERLSYKGYGSSKPKFFPEVTEQDRQANRRVEIKVL